MCSLEEAQNNYFSFLTSNGPKDQKYLVEWIDQCLTIEEIKEALLQTVPYSKEELLAFKRWFDLCTSVEEIIEAYEEISLRTDRSEEPVSMEKLALEKWNEFSVKEMFDAMTVKEVQEALKRSPDKSSFEDLIKKKEPVAEIIGMQKLEELRKLEEAL
jgi:hypothetical protein